MAPPSAAVTAAGRPEQPAPTTSTSTSTTSDELTLTRNTVKTYIKRIYGKLGVHSQQELIDLVEAGALIGGAAGSARHAGCGAVRLPL